MAVKKFFHNEIVQRGEFCTLLTPRHAAPSGGAIRREGAGLLNGCWEGLEVAWGQVPAGLLCDHGRLPSRGLGFLSTN